MSAGTLLFSGTDLTSVCIIGDLSDFWSSSDVRGDLPTYPGVDGAAPLRRPVASKLCSGQVATPSGLTTLAAAEDSIAAIKAILRVNQAQTLTRRKVTGTGNLDATQNAIVRTAAERWITPLACTLLLSVELLDGQWYAAAATNIPVAAGTQSIAGDLRTHKMTVTLAAGAARTVTNTTNGHAFTFSTTVPTGGILIDVEARTATAITGGADYSASLSWTKRYPMVLDAGTNVLTVSAGSASIDYYPAYQ